MIWTIEVNTYGRWGPSWPSDKPGCWLTKREASKALAEVRKKWPKLEWRIAKYERVNPHV